MAALAAAVAMMASVAIMVGSFRETVVVWLDYQLRADLYLRPAHASGARRFPALSPEIPGMVASLPGVEAVDAFKPLNSGTGAHVRHWAEATCAWCCAMAGCDFFRQDREMRLGSLPGADHAIVSEPFANKHGLRAGDRILLPLGDRSVEFTVAGVYYEYSYAPFIPEKTSATIKGWVRKFCSLRARS